MVVEAAERSWRTADCGGFDPSWRREKLVALQDADCTTVGGEFDFREAAAHRAEKALGEFRSHMLDAVRVGLQVRFRLVVHRSGSGLRVQIEGIVSGKVHFDSALSSPHGVDSGADEVAVEKNIAGSGKQVHVGEPRLQKLSVAAHRVEVELSGALRTYQRSVGGPDQDRK